MTTPAARIAKPGKSVAGNAWLLAFLNGALLFAPSAVASSPAQMQATASYRRDRSLPLRELAVIDHPGRRQETGGAENPKIPNAHVDSPDRVVDRGNPARLCARYSSRDPVVLYDQLADRWVISQFASASGGAPITDECVAVSTTGDATGTYNCYAFHLEGIIVVGNEAQKTIIRAIGPSLRRGRRERRAAGSHLGTTRQQRRSSRHE